MIGYIYKTTNMINGRIYIGQSKSEIDKSYLGSGKIIKEAIKKYGRKNFKTVVIAFATTKEMLDCLEKKHISEHRAIFGNGFLYNISDGGGGGRHNGTCICTVCRRMRFEVENNTKSHKINCGCATCKMKRGEMMGENNPNFGNHLSPEARKRIGKANRHPRLHSESCQCPFCNGKRLKLSRMSAHV